VIADELNRLRKLEGPQHKMFAAKDLYPLTYSAANWLRRKVK
jgi:hypothetical protein